METGPGTPQALTEIDLKRLENAAENIKSLEDQIRTLLGGHAQYASLSLVVIAASITYSTVGATALVYVSAAILLTILGLSNLNAAIDARALGEFRDHLSSDANELLGADIYLTGALSKTRRLSVLTITIYLFVCVINVGIWLIAVMSTDTMAWRILIVTGFVVSIAAYVVGLRELLKKPAETQEWLKDKRTAR